MKTAADTYLTEHFSLAELTVSQWAARHGVSNQPPDDLVPNLRRLAELLEQIRTLLEKPLIINSAYRSLPVNRAVGGARTSQHCFGQAADIICPAYGGPLIVAMAIYKSRIFADCDQLICEFEHWVHVSIPAAGRKARNSVLTICHGGGYEKGLRSCANP